MEENKVKRLYFVPPPEDPRTATAAAIFMVMFKMGCTSEDADKVIPLILDYFKRKINEFTFTCSNNKMIRVNRNDPGTDIWFESQPAKQSET